MSIVSLVLVGAGCGSGQVAVPAQQANTDTAVAFEGVDLRERTSEAAADEPVSTGPGTSADAQWPRPTSFPGMLPPAEIHGKAARIATAKGDIVFELLDGEAPKTVSNFIALARSGYFDGLTFHRVVPGFVIQGGDPAGDGTGGPGYSFEDEPVRLNYDAGIVAMANAGPDTNGSQFFIVLEDQPTLPKNYTIFGRVLSGMEAVRSIQIGDTMLAVRIEDR